MSERTPFYITGLPRSRTAWLANLFYDPGFITSYHEILPRADWSRGVESFKADLIRRSGEYPPAHLIGVVDTGLYSAAPRLPELWPGPIVIVRRAVDDVCQSLLSWAGTTTETEEGMAIVDTAVRLEMDLEAFTEYYGTLGWPLLEVPFTALNDLAVVEMVWNHCTGGDGTITPVPLARVKELMHMRVDVSADTMLRRTDVDAVQHMREFGTMLQLPKAEPVDA